VAEPGPLAAEVSAGAVDRLGDVGEMLLGVEQVDDLDGAGKQFVGQVPSPGGTIAKLDSARGAVEAAAARFAVHAVRERREAGGGVGTGGAPDGRRVGDRARVPGRDALRVAPFCGLDGDQFDLARFGRAPSGCLPTRPVSAAVRIGRPVPSTPRYTGGAVGGVDSTTCCSSIAIARPSVSAVRSTCLASTSTPASACSNSCPSTKLTIAPTSRTMRVTASDSDVPIRPSTASCGYKPAAHAAQSQ